MNLFKIFMTTVCLSTIFLSCEKTIDFNSADIEPKIVVNAVFQAGSKYKYVRVEKSRSILNDKNYFEALPGASVKLYEDDVFVADLPYTSRIDTFREYLNYGVIKTYPYENGYYLDSTLVVKSGSTYRLEILPEGHNLVTCETTVPYPVALNYLNLELEKSSSDYFYMQFKIKCRLNISNTETEDNFFRLYTRQEQGIDLSNYTYSGYNGYGTNTTATDTIIKLLQYSMYIDSQDPVLSSFSNTDILGTNEDFNTLFTNELMTGGNYTLSFNTYTNRDVATDIGEYIRVAAIVENISKELYYYAKSQNQQTNVRENPFAEPVPVYSNINGGIGIFGSAAASSFESIIGEYPVEGKTYFDQDDYMKNHNYNSGY